MIGHELLIKGNTHDKWTAGGPELIDKHILHFAAQLRLVEHPPEDGPQ